ncbi:sugar transferase [Blautia sp.]|uniref:sugar transferase n=1 Tax=Blautia sp. TaxID=1955243 RepID=UPI003AB55318
MYKKSAQGWLKHWDFILLDIICLQLSFIIAYHLRQGDGNLYADHLYSGVAISFILCQIVVMFFSQSYQGILKRGYYAEFTKTVKHVCMVMLLSMAYLFVTQQSEQFSRIIFFITAGIYLVVAYIARLLWKRYVLRKNLTDRHKKSMVLVVASDEAEITIKRMMSGVVQDFVITGIAFMDKGFKGDTFNEIPVVGDIDTVKEYLRREWVDEVFIKITDTQPYPVKLIDEIVTMGLTVHMSLGSVEQSLPGKKFVEKVGDYTVVTSSINTITPKEMIYKRVMDIAGGIVGCLITLLLIITIGPMIYIKSPGPIFFSQIRIGKNGKRFKIYKFRSMYMDAEARKAELMSQNKMDGFMFKMDYDPRIIGSEKKDKNGNPKGIGNFIRKTSLDEFPQFWNVLKGDMSLVGTRPPTVDEWEKYELHHRSRMSTKPGITGMWQVSGRSDITDFEEVVRLDTEYIEHWTIGLDIKILIKTVLAVVKHEGSV